MEHIFGNGFKQMPMCSIFTDGYDPLREEIPEKPAGKCPVDKVFTTRKGGPFGPPFLEGLPPTKEGKTNSRIIPLLHSNRSGSPLSDRWNGGAISL